MNPLTVASLIVVIAWLPAATRMPLARNAVLLVLAQGTATVVPRLTPVALAAWLYCGLSLPDGLVRSRHRRLLAVFATAGSAVWAIATPVTPGYVLTAAVGVATVVLGAMLLRYAKATVPHRRALQWAAAGGMVATAAVTVIGGVHVLLDLPRDPLPWTLAAMAVLPVGVLLGQFDATARLAERALVEAIVIAGMAVLVVAVYLVVVVGLARSPTATDRDLLLASVLAALTAVVLALPLRLRLVALAQALLGRRGQSPEEALASFGARMSRAVPFDELLLQLAESLRATLGPAGAEVWVGTDGVMHRTVSVPDRAGAALTLNEKERLVVGHARIGGNAWLSVWLPSLVEERDAPVRVAPAAHLGDLLGLLVVRRPPDGAEFSEEDDRVLSELARQVGLALHNMRLDSELQASLEELRQRNEELQASRLRIVTAADASRRAIERDLHDGAQQHLVALSVKLGLARELISADPSLVKGLLEELHDDLQQTNASFRELAHGIYPPLLRIHGLGEALRSVTRRIALPYEVRVDLPSRYPEEIEAAVYFCCLEAIQNAAKYAGPAASVSVAIHAADGALTFEVSDDGTGFEPGTRGGHGFVNMTDRLGAIGGALRIDSAPGRGTTVRGSIPLGL